MQNFQKDLKIKDDVVLTILDLTVMSQHKCVSDCFHYAITMALSIITDHLICIKGCTVRCQTYTTISQSQQWAFIFESTIPPCLFKQSILMRGSKQDRKKAYCF